MSAKKKASSSSKSNQPKPVGGAGKRQMRYHAGKGAKVYSIAASLRSAHRPIWRMVLVVDFMPLDSFHNVLQVLFGWDNAHLYCFERPSKKLFFDGPGACDDGFGASGETHRPSSAGTVKDLLPRKGSKAVYCYDFGDMWELDLQVVATIGLDDYGFSFLPVCADGEGAAPPEDVGGVYGYERFCEIMADPKHPEHAEMAEWAGFEEGEVFDEAWFDPHDINTTFADAMIAANPEMIPDDPAVLRKRYAELLADSFVMDAEMQLTMGAAVQALEEMMSDYE